MHAAENCLPHSRDFASFFVGCEKKELEGKKGRIERWEEEGP
jgi:hypothetical protein